MFARSIRKLWVAFVELEPLPTCPVDGILGGYTTAFVRAVSEEVARHSIIRFMESNGFSVTNLEIGKYRNLPPREKRKRVMRRLERDTKRLGGVHIGSVFSWDTDDD